MHARTHSLSNWAQYDDAEEKDGYDEDEEGEEEK